MILKMVKIGFICVMEVMNLEKLGYEEINGKYVFDGLLPALQMKNDMTWYVKDLKDKSWFLFYTYMIFARRYVIVNKKLLTLK